MKIEGRWKGGFSDYRYYYLGEFQIASLYRTKRGFSTDVTTMARGAKQHKTLDEAIARAQEEANRFVWLLNPDLEVDHDATEPTFSEVTP